MGIFSNFIGRLFGRQQMPVFFTEGHDGTRSTLSEEDAMRVATIYACVRIISEDIGTLPLHVKTRTESGKGKVQNGHPVSRLMRRPNPYMNGIDFRCALIASLELYGNAYAIVRERGKRGYATRIDLLDPRSVKPIAGEHDVYYSVADMSELVPSRDMVHIKGYAPDGIEGKSPVRMHQDLIENFINATKFSKKLYKNDLRSAAVFSLDGVLPEEAYQRVKAQLSEAWKKVNSDGTKPLILEGGTKVSTMTITPESAQYVPTKLQLIDEIAACYRVPCHKVGDWTRGTYSNNTQANLEYFTDCLRPILEKVEEELSVKLFLESELDTHYIDINFKGLLRTAIAEQMEIYNKMFNIGVYSINEIRAMEDLEPYEGGDRYFVPVNLAVNDKNLTVTTNDKHIE